MRFSSAALLLMAPSAGGFRQPSHLTASLSTSLYSASMDDVSDLVSKVTAEGSPPMETMAAAPARASTSSFTSLIDRAKDTGLDEPGTAPTFVDYWRDYLSTDHSVEVTMPDIPKEQFIAAWNAVTHLPPGASYDDIVQALNYDELGNWYIGAVALAGGVLANERNNRAFGIKAPPRVNKGTKSAPKSKAVPVSKAIQNDADLMQVVKQLKALETERAKMDSQFTELRSEIKTMKATINEDKKVEKTLRADLKASEATIKKQADQMFVLEKKIATLKGEPLPSKPVAPKPAQKATRKAPAKKAPTKAKGAPAPVEQDVKVKEALAPVEQDVKVKEAPAPVEQDVKVKEAPAPVEQDVEVIISDSKPPHNVSDAFFAEPEAALKGNAEAPPKKNAATKKVASKKAPAKKKTVASEGDWSKLAPSTLKRKTVKDLTQYLENKGEPTKGKDGKALKKAELVDAVLAVKA